MIDPAEPAPLAAPAANDEDELTDMQILDELTWAYPKWGGNVAEAVMIRFGRACIAADQNLKRDRRALSTTEAMQPAEPQTDPLIPDGLTEASATPAWFSEFKELVARAERVGIRFTQAEPTTDRYCPECNGLLDWRCPACKIAASHMNAADCEVMQAALPAEQSGQLNLQRAYDEMVAQRDGADVPALRDVIAERERQKTVEGWTLEHDDEHRAGQMARAAAVYAILGSSDGRTVLDDGSEPSWSERLWPWDWSWLKPKSRRANLVKAGALILAEIERLDRALAGAKHEGV